MRRPAEARDGRTVSQPHPAELREIHAALVKAIASDLANYLAPRLLRATPMAFRYALDEAFVDYGRAVAELADAP